MKITKRILFVFFAIMFILFPNDVSKAQSNILTEAQRQKLIEVSKTTVGAPYVRAVQNPSITNGFDCDSLVWYVLRNALGFEIPNREDNIEDYAVEITRDELQPGDLIGFDGTEFGNDGSDGTRPGSITHVMLYLGPIDSTGVPKIVQATSETNPWRNPEIDNEVVIEDAERFMIQENFKNHKFMRVYGVNNAKKGHYFVNRDATVVTTSNNRDDVPYRLPSQLPLNTYIEGIEFDNNYVRFIYNGPDTSQNGKVAYIPKHNLNRSGSLVLENRLIPQTDSTAPINSNKFFYIFNQANIRDMNGNVIGTKVRGESFQGYRDGDYYIFQEGGILKKVHYTLVTNVKTPIRAKALRNFNAYRASDRQLIGEVRRETIMNVYQDNPWIIFDYNGTNASTGATNFEFLNVVDTSKNPMLDGLTTPDQPTSPVGPTEPLIPEGTLFINGLSNIRDINGNVVGTMRKGESIVGKLNGNYYEFEQNGQFRKVYITNVSKNIVFGDAYTILASNIRRISDDSIASVYSKGRYISGYQIGDYVHFVLNGQTVKVHRSLVLFGSPQTRYITQTANIRNAQNSVVGVEYPGKKILVIRIGDYYRYADNGNIYFVWHSLTSTTQPNVTYYVKADSNVRNSAGTVIETKLKGTPITGIEENGRLRFVENGQTKYIYLSQLSITPISATGYTTTGVNVRRASDNSAVSLYRIGTEITGTRQDGKIFFTINGTRVYVYDSLMTYARKSSRQINTNSVNIRTQTNQVRYTFNEGQKIYAVRVGNYYVFDAAGQTLIVWHTFVR